MTTPSQPAEVLESLLGILACPLDNSAALSAVRNTAGEVVALASARAEYPVSGNIPSLIPELGHRARGDLPLWQAHQAKMWREYEAGDPGVFTPEGHTMGRQVGEIIARSGVRLCLDVGCGALPWPAYMSASSESVEWIGVDPFPGDTVRRFPFVHGLGEYLPFRPGVFGGALYAGTIYQLLDPRRSLRRVYNILKPKGKLFVWYTASRLGRKYLVWKGLRSLGIARMYDADYVWAFTQRSLRAELERAGFSVQDSVFLCEACPDLSTCDAASEYLAIAHRT